MNIDAFILIGGRSSRFGQDKASTIFGETSLVERTATTIRQAFPTSRITLVAAGDDQFSARFGLEHGYKVVHDLYQARGPFAGVHTALASAQTEWALVMACDFPFVSIELLRHLSSYISDKTDAISPVQSDGKIQPLCSFYCVSPCLEVMTKTLKAEALPLPLKSVFGAVRTRTVQFEELSRLPNTENLFLNLNTPEDFQQAARIMQSFGDPERESQS